MDEDTLAVGLEALLSVEELADYLGLPVQTIYESRNALDERQQLIEQRAHALVRAAIADQEPWIRHLASPPRDPARHAATVAAYRDRYQITAPSPLGGPPVARAQKADSAAARHAVRLAHHMSVVQPHVEPTGFSSHAPVSRHDAPSL